MCHPEASRSFSSEESVTYSISSLWASFISRYILNNPTSSFIMFAFIRLHSFCLCHVVLVGSISINISSGGGGGEAAESDQRTQTQRCVCSPAKSGCVYFCDTCVGVTQTHPHRQNVNMEAKPKQSKERERERKLPHSLHMHRSTYSVAPRAAELSNALCVGFGVETLAVEVFGKI